MEGTFVPMALYCVLEDPPSSKQPMYPILSKTCAAMYSGVNNFSSPPALQHTIACHFYQSAEISLDAATQSTNTINETAALNNHQNTHAQMQTHRCCFLHITRF